MNKDAGNDTAENKTTVEENKSAQQSGEKITAQSAVQRISKDGVGKGWRWLAFILILALLVLSGAASWFGLQLQQEVIRTGETSRQQEALIASIDQRLEDEKAARARGEEKFAEKQTGLEDALNAQAETIAELTTLDRDQWVVAELEYLVRLANQRLLTERRPRGAKAILETADKLLGTMDDPKALVVRQVLAADIAALRLVEVVDREGIYTRLGALAPALLSLTALPPKTLSHQAETENAGDPAIAPVNAGVVVGQEPSPAMPWYDRLWLNARVALSRFGRDHFHVRYRDVPIEPLISTEQEQWLRHDMAISVANAQQALLREEQQIYDASLASVKRRLEEYFAGADGAQKLLEEVQVLQTSSIQQQLPDISGSIKAIKQLQSGTPVRREARP